MHAMQSAVVTQTELVTGNRLGLDEFLSVWEELPELKNAELIDGVVYVSSPVSREHGSLDGRVALWLGYYAQATPGSECALNSTWLMLGNAPQPDSCLRILPSHGGQSGNEKKFATGAPELAVEICVTSTDYDFGPKLRLYERAGVREYITIETFRERIVWRVLTDGKYAFQLTSDDGILRSEVFPGLWLDVAALWAGDGPKMLAALNAGLATEEHRRFAEHLAVHR
jgi:Uma2 family endonuclease